MPNIKYLHFLALVKGAILLLLNIVFQHTGHTISLIHPLINTCHGISYVIHYTFQCHSVIAEQCNLIATNSHCYWNREAHSSAVKPEWQFNAVCVNEEGNKDQEGCQSSVHSLNGVQWVWVSHGWLRVMRADCLSPDSWHAFLSRADLCFLELYRVLVSACMQLQVWWPADRLWHLGCRSLICI